MGIAGIFVLGAAIWFVYGRAIDAPFIFDDHASVFENGSIKQLWPLLGDEIFRGPLNPKKDLPTSGRPLVNLSLALNYSWGGENPRGYHLFNLFWHWLCALLVWAIVRRTLRLPYFQGRFENTAGPLAWTVAVVWAFHPLQSETVIYVTQRTELMVAVFYLATLYCSLRYWATESGAQRHLWLATATIACFLGMACKEVMVTAPLVVLIFERTFIHKSLVESLRKSWPLYVGLAASWLLLLYLNVDRPRSSSAGFDLSVSPVEWWMTQAKVLVMYLRLAIWPWPLVIQYEMPYLNSLGTSWPWLAIVLLLGAGTLWLLWQRRAAGFVGAWVFLILSPTSIVPIITEIAAERRMYLPLAALVALVIVGGYALLQQFAAKPNSAKHASSFVPTAAACIALLLAIGFAAIDIHRLADYQSEIALWRSTVVYQPQNYKAHHGLGSLLEDAGDLPQALEEYQLALQIKPDWAESYISLGNSAEDRGDLSGALRFYEKAREVDPKCAAAYVNIGRLRTEQGLSDQAANCYQQALDIKPDFPDAQYNLANALVRTNRVVDALPHYRRAIELRPDYAEARYNLATLLLVSGEVPEAIGQFELALKIKPDILDAYLALSKAYQHEGRTADAVSIAEAGLKLTRTKHDDTKSNELENWLTAIRGNPTSAVSPRANLPAVPLPEVPAPRE